MRDLFLKICVALQTLQSSEQGQDLVEYALLVCLIALGGISGVRHVATAVASVFGNESSSLASFEARLVIEHVAGHIELTQPWTGPQNVNRSLFQERLDVSGFPATIQPFLCYRFGNKIQHPGSILFGAS